MAPNITTTRERCGRGCRYTYWRNYGHVSIGDVRRCEHGKVWRATGYKRESRFFLSLDEWESLSRWRNPVLYRRAVRALESPQAAKEGMPSGC